MGVKIREIGHYPRSPDHVGPIAAEVAALLPRLVTSEVLRVLLSYMIWPWSICYIQTLYEIFHYYQKLKSQ